MTRLMLVGTVALGLACGVMLASLSALFELALGGDPAHPAWLVVVGATLALVAGLVVVGTRRVDK